MTEFQVTKLGHTFPVSMERLAEMRAEADHLDRWMNASPEQRAEWAREAVERRAIERAAAAPVPLTVDTLLAKLNWSREYAEHVVQPYCWCYDGPDQWETCSHADDLGVRP